MGYSTDFLGTFTITPPLNLAQTAYLRKFAEIRHMKRDAEITSTRPDPLRLAVGLPVGVEGGYFVGSTGWPGQEGMFGGGGSALREPPDLLDHNEEPEGQHGLWCHWQPTEDGAGLEWDGSEKFYNFSLWLVYIIEHFLKPWGRVLSGDVRYHGESYDDYGTLHVADNIVEDLKQEGEPLREEEDEDF